MTTYKNIRIAGFGLEAVLRENNTVEMVDSKTSKTIVLLTNPGPRVLRQFEGFTNYRAGANASTKMNIILECLTNVPEMQNYL